MTLYHAQPLLPTVQVEHIVKGDEGRETAEALDKVVSVPPLMEVAKSRCFSLGSSEAPPSTTCPLA